MAKRLSLYAVFSGFAALVNFGSRFGYDHLLSRILAPTLAYVAGVALAYLTGMVVNFVLSKYVTFQAHGSGRTRREAAKFLAIALLGLLTTVLGSYAAYFALTMANGRVFVVVLPDQLMRTGAHLCGMALGLVVNFVGHDRFSFRATGMWDRLMQVMQEAGSARDAGDSE